MRRWLPALIALGVSLGVVGAYLVGGGASYQPLQVADPCEPRSEAVLEQRGVFEGILLSGLDGAACELGVSREELVAALSDDGAMAAFSEANDLDSERVDDAIRSGLIRAVDDAEMQGRLPTAIASIARGLAENAPVGTVISLFEALPGDPSLPEVIQAIGDAGLSVADLDDAAVGAVQGLLDDAGALPGGLGEALGGLEPDAAGDLLPEGLDQQQLQEDLEGVLP